MSYPARVFAGVVVIVAMVLLTVFAVARTEARRNADAAAVRALEQSADLVAQLLAGRGRSLAGGARVFVQGPYFRTLVAENRRDDILDQTFEAAEQLEASWVFIADASGVLVAKSDEPSASGDQLANVALVSGALRGQVMTGFGGSGDSALFQATAVPVAAPGGSPFGVLVATRLLDSAMAVDIAAATGGDLVFYVRTPDGIAHAAASTLPRDAELRAALQRRPSRQEPVRINGHNWITHATALNTAGGTEVGGYLVLRSADVDVAALAALRRALIMAGAIGLLLALGAAAVARQTVANPVEALVRSVQSLGTDPAESSPVSPIASAASHGALADLADAIGTLRTGLHDQAVLRAATSQSAAAQVVVTPGELDSASEPVRSPLMQRLRSERMLSFPVVRRDDGGSTPFALGSIVAHRYRLDAVLGERDHGVLYRAFDRTLGLDVAFGIVRPERLFLDPELRAQLATDVQRARKISDPHVATPLDVGDVHGTLYVTSQYVPGVSLARMLRERAGHPMPADVVLGLARQLLRALAAAHAHDVVHGAIAPSDVRLTSGGDARLTGFGIGHVLGEAARRAQTALRAGDPALSGRLVGATVGRPEYLAPEQLIGASATIASDLFTIGVVLRECLSGHVPSPAGTPLTLIGARLRADDGDKGRTDAFAGATVLDEVIRELTESEVSRRIPSALRARDRLR